MELLFGASKTHALLEAPGDVCGEHWVDAVVSSHADGLKASLYHQALPAELVTAGTHTQRPVGHTHSHRHRRPQGLAVPPGAAGRAGHCRYTHTEACRPHTLTQTQTASRPRCTTRRCRPSWSLQAHTHSTHTQRPVGHTHSHRHRRPQGLAVPPGAAGRAGHCRHTHTEACRPHTLTQTASRPRCTTRRCRPSWSLQAHTHRGL